MKTLQQATQYIRAGAWITFEQNDGTCAGLICPSCASMNSFQILHDERAIAVTCEIDGLRKCSVCDIEHRCYEDAENVIADVEIHRRASRFMDLCMWLMKLVVYTAFTALVFLMLCAFFNLL